MRMLRFLRIAGHHRRYPYNVTPFRYPLVRHRKRPKEPCNMGNFKVIPPKECPFCPEMGYKFVYFHGLLRHVQREHMHNSAHQSIGFLAKEDLRFVRKYHTRYSKYEDFQIAGYRQLEEWISHYCREEWNPSLRDIA